MARRIPPEAFTDYVALGVERTYDAIARKYHVSRRAVTKAAKREKWQERLGTIETKAREKTEAKAVESIEAMNTRHLKMLRAIQQKALEALRTMSIGTGADAARALVLAIDRERVLFGEPSDRTAVSVEDIIKREYERWMKPVGGGGQTKALPDEPGDAAGEPTLPPPTIPIRGAEDDDEPGA